MVAGALVKVCSKQPHVLQRCAGRYTLLKGSVPRLSWSKDRLQSELADTSVGCPSLCARRGGWRVVGVEVTGRG